MTFTAMIIACHVANNAMCMTITDNRGPYDSSEKCEARIEEMIGDLISLWTYTRTPMVFKWTGCLDPFKQSKGEAT